MVQRRSRGALALVTAVVAGMIAPAAPCALHAQEAYRASWTLQDASQGFSQALAESVIARVNDWLTRADPNAPTARVDDLLRVTVSGRLTPGGGLQVRLSRLVCGSIAIDSDFDEFLDSATIALLVRRDHYWRDEMVEVFNRDAVASSPYIIDTRNGTADLAAAGDRTQIEPRARIGLDEAAIQLDDDLSIRGGLGMEGLALPGFSAGVFRAGLGYGALRVWGLFPAPIGTASGALFARGLEGAFGIGVGFEQTGFGGVVNGIGGMVTAASPVTGVASAATADSIHYALGKSALVYGIADVPQAIVPDASARVKAGVGYIEATALPANGVESSTASAPGLGRFAPMLSAELRFDDGANGARRIVGVGLFGGNVTASWQEQITSALGLRVAGAVNGVVGERPPYLPPVVIFISPVISIP